MKMISVKVLMVEDAAVPWSVPGVHGRLSAHKKRKQIKRKIINGWRHSQILERPSRESVSSPGTAVLLYNSPPAVAVVLYGDNKPIASEVYSLFFVFFSISLCKSSCHTLSVKLAPAKRNRTDKERKKKKTASEPTLRNKRPHWRKEKPEKTDGGQKMRRLNWRNFLPGLKGPFRIFAALWLISGASPSVWRCPPVNHSRHGACALKRRSVEFAFLPACFCPCLSKIEKKKRKENQIPSPCFRKHFDNFKYNHFLSGTVPGIIHMCLRFIYGLLFTL